jgi:hypothetical protein
LRTRHMTNAEFQRRLVVHFDVLFHHGLLYWPTRHGLAPFKEEARDDTWLIHFIICISWTFTIHLLFVQCQGARTA